MLDLPPGWLSHTTESAVHDMMCQANSLGMYERASRAIVRASLEFMLAGPRWGKRGIAIREEGAAWRINDWAFYVVGRMDDCLLDDMERLRPLVRKIDVITDPWCERIVRHAIKHALRDPAIDVMAVDRYVNLRTFLTTMDIAALQPDRGRCGLARELFERYSRLVADTPAIDIRLPDPPPPLHP